MARPMLQVEKDSKPRRNKRAYTPRTNAVCISIYQPQGDNIAPEVIEACQGLIQEIAQQHNLLIAVVTT